MISSFQQSVNSYFQCDSMDAFDGYQIRSSEGNLRYWLLMALAHIIACISCREETMSLCFIQSYPRGTDLLHLSVWGEARSFLGNRDLSCIILLGNFLNLHIYSIIN